MPQNTCSARHGVKNEGARDAFESAQNARGIGGACSEVRDCHQFSACMKLPLLFFVIIRTTSHALGFKTIKNTWFRNFNVENDRPVRSPYRRNACKTQRKHKCKVHTWKLTGSGAKARNSHQFYLQRYLKRGKIEGTSICLAPNGGLAPAFETEGPNTHGFWRLHAEIRVTRNLFDDGFRVYPFGFGRCSGNGRAMVGRGSGDGRAMLSKIGFYVYSVGVSKQLSPWKKPSTRLWPEGRRIISNY